MRNFKPKDLWFLVKTTVTDFLDEDPFRLAGALAYNAIFSLPPTILIVITAAGFFWGEEAVSGKLYAQLDNILGQKTAAEIQNLVQKASINKSGTAAIIGLATLLFAATTFMVTLQKSLNTMWNVMPRPENSILKTIKDRLLSLSLLLSLAFLLLISFMISAGMAILSDYLKQLIPGAGRIFLQIGGIALSISLIVVIFALIFKYLPDTVMRWKDVWLGAIVTAALFILGKFGIGFYIGTTDMHSSYGAAGSLIILLVWIYYSSLILFFGAELTQVWANNFGSHIRPKKSAVKMVRQAVTEEEYMRSKTGRPPSEGKFEEG